MIVLVAFAVSVVVAYCVYRRIQNDNKPSVTDGSTYQKILRKHIVLLESGIYVNPENYSGNDGKLVSTSPQLLLAKKQINASFRDKIPWCMPGADLWRRRGEWCFSIHRSVSLASSL